jgi:hypothetical protein
MSGRQLRVRNLERFQHYHDRTPPWVKLHQETLENYEFGELPDATKYHALAIVLLASRTENSLPDDPAWIARKINAKTRVDLAALVSADFLEVYQDASDELAESTQNAPRAGARSASLSVLVLREGEESNGGVLSPSKPTTAAEVSRVFARHLLARERWYTKQNGRRPSHPPELTQRLAKAIREAIKVHGVEKAMAAGVGIFYSPFHTGRNDSGQLYLDPALCWRIKRDQDNVEKFADIYFNHEGKEAIRDE